MSDLLKSALNCIEKGWFIFPLLEKEKKPDLSLAPHWSEDSSNDVEKITEWWTKNPNANIGVDLGRSGLTVLDFDDGEPPPNLGLPQTLVVRTSRGQHWYYSGPAAQGDMYFGGKHVGEVKSTGGYVVGPRSLHESGAKYSVINRATVADAPHELIVKLKAKGPEAKAPIATEGPIPYGQHYNTLLAIAGMLRHGGAIAEEIETTLVRVCETRCENPGADYPEMCHHLAYQMGKKPVGSNEATVLINNVPMDGPNGKYAQHRLSADVVPQVVNIDDWRDFFRSVGELEDGDVRMIINDFLPEGINFVGALSGHGKTLVALSMVKSLTTGGYFLGKYQPEEILPCLYLIPESSSRAFKMRCRAFGIPDDPELFLCRTITEGVTLLLDDPILLRAVQVMKPVIFLDTMIRFSYAQDENSASENQRLAKDILALRSAGAVAVVGLHHSTKSSAKEEMTLENCLRGTGDIAALCDSVYAIRRDQVLYDDGNGPNEIDVKCVKPRDIKNPPKPFRIAATYQKEDKTIVSYIDESHDFFLVESAAVIAELESKFIKVVTADSSISRADLASDLGISEHALRKLAKKLGWSRPPSRNGVWAIVRKDPPPAPPVRPAHPDDASDPADDEGDTARTEPGSALRVPKTKKIVEPEAPGFRGLDPGPPLKIN